ncbi:MAG: (5-formylfuran-3-yl)methyl phosphate synthase [Candidatus Bathyarchaeota archaeon]|nr:(5-formylfuran-3-yl)methyl phosphate synthase [Candidatus Bathyarchaeum tardum]WGM90282.1 MAG: (5-formylfuran-3-yl)methyl phosphate synthase [Candidatus Bathyarchaeum tardum]
MKLLVSVVNKTEAEDSIKGGADIIDVKNPKEGSLGANFPNVICEVKGVMPKNLELSATIGDLPNLPGTASLAALGAAVSGADYVKAGLFGVKTVEEATTLMIEVVRAVKEYNSDLKVIASGYADFENVGCVSPLKLPEVAHKSGADGALIDVKVKDGKSNLFTFLDDSQLATFVTQAHNYSILAALAGSLVPQDISRVNRLGADIIGVRGAVCTKKDRVSGKLEQEKVADFVFALSKL